MERPLFRNHRLRLGQFFNSKDSAHEREEGTNEDVLSGFKIAGSYSDSSGDESGHTCKNKGSSEARKAMKPQHGLSGGECYQFDGRHGNSYGITRLVMASSTNGIICEQYEARYVPSGFSASREPRIEPDRGFTLGSSAWSALRPAVLCDKRSVAV